MVTVPLMSEREVSYGGEHVLNGKLNGPNRPGKFRSARGNWLKPANHGTQYGIMIAATSTGVGGEPCGRANVQ